MKISFERFLKNPLIWALIGAVVLDVSAYFIFKCEETILAAIITGSVVMFGYFATHYLTILRDQRTWKFERCLELTKTLRLFILEEHTKGTEKQREMRNSFQDTYFAFSLLTSQKSYEAMSKMMEAFKIHLNCKVTCECDFNEKQKDFINKLRKEFFIDKEINFKTYDIRLSQDKK